MQDIAGLEEFLRGEQVDIAIVTVPGQAAQSIIDRLVAGPEATRVRAILNFAPVKVLTPKDVVRAPGRLLERTDVALVLPRPRERVTCRAARALSDALVARRGARSASRCASRATPSCVYSRLYGALTGDVARRRLCAGARARLRGLPAALPREPRRRRRRRRSRRGCWPATTSTPAACTSWRGRGDVESAGPADAAHVGLLVAAQRGAAARARRRPLGADGGRDRVAARRRQRRRRAQRLRRGRPADRARPRRAAARACACARVRARRGLGRCATPRPVPRRRARPDDRTTEESP